MSKYHRQALAREETGQIVQVFRIKPPLPEDSLIIYININKSSSITKLNKHDAKNNLQKLLYVLDYAQTKKLLLHMSGLNSKTVTA